MSRPVVLALALLVAAPALADQARLTLGNPCATLYRMSSTTYAISGEAAGGDAVGGALVMNVTSALPLSGGSMEGVWAPIFPAAITATILYSDDYYDCAYYRKAYFRIYSRFLKHLSGWKYNPETDEYERPW